MLRFLLAANHQTAMPEDRYAAEEDCAMSQCKPAAIQLPGLGEEATGQVLQGSFLATAAMAHRPAAARCAAQVLC